MAVYKIICSSNSYLKAQTDESYKRILVEKAKKNLVNNFYPEDQFLISAREEENDAEVDCQSREQNENQDINTLLEESRNLIKEAEEGEPSSAKKCVA